jgi:hypothetical protein
LAAIVAATLALYATVAGYDFVYDDHWTIERNRGLGAPLARIFHALLYGEGARLGLADKTRPTMVLSMWIDRRLFGLSPAGFHAHSVLLYVLATVLAWWSLRILLGRPRAALLGALFFAAAPLHAEVVACVDYREDLLVAVNGLAVFALFFADRRLGAPRPGALEVAAVAIAMLLALGAKESGLVLPALIAAMAWARKDDLAFLRRREAFVVAILVTTLAFLNWRIGAPDDVPRAHDPGLALRALATARYEVHAVLGAFVPFFWSPERARPPAASAVWLFPFAALVALLLWLRRAPRTRPYALALAFALVAPLASCPMALPANELADRYLFLGVFGGAIAFGTAVDRALEHVRLVVRRSAATLAAAVLAVAAGVTLHARAAFRSDEDLWKAAVARAPDSPRAWTGLSHVRRLQGKLTDADEADARALALDPSYAPARLTHVYNLLARGDVLEARAELSALVDEEHIAGLRRARECAALESSQAQACIGP